MITISVERGLVRLKSWEDMHETPGFARDIDPKAVRLKEIIGIYAFDSKQPCGLKSCRQPHGNGYLVTTTNGIVTNIGSVCGKNNFSVAFTNLRKAFDRDFKAKERRERLGALKPRISAILETIEAVKEKAGPFYKAIRYLNGDSGAMPEVIVNAVRNMRRNGNGAIELTRKASRQELELALATGNARPRTPYYVTDTVGHLVGIGAINAIEALKSTIQDLEPALRKLDAQDPDAIVDKEARYLDKILSGLDIRIEQLQQAADLLMIFANKKNLSQLSVLLESASDKQLFLLFIDSLPST